jgi:hypothetical protein
MEASGTTPPASHMRTLDILRSAWIHTAQPAILSPGFKVDAKGRAGWPKYLLV